MQDILYNSIMEKFEVNILSETFYDKYSSDLYPEIMDKGEKRPYLILLVEIDGKTFGLPFRSNINHKYAFMIKNERNLNEGVDFSKALVLNQEDIGRKAHLKPGTYREICTHIDLIIEMFKKYLEKFNKIAHKEIRNIVEERIYEMSTLKYFLDQWYNKFINEVDYENSRYRHWWDIH